MKRSDLVDYLNNILNSSAISDYCPNGLQVEGQDEIRTIVTGVTACQALIDQAIAKQADTLLVHHGYFWKGEVPSITGLKKNRLQALLENNINLLAYHLPLDVHPSLGNNAQLSHVLDIQVTDVLACGGVDGLLYVGELKEVKDGASFESHLQQRLNRNPLHICADKNIKTIAWCTGAAQDFIDDAALLGVDAYLSGEVSERTVHSAREYGLHYFACGHHATERYGIQALGQHLSDRFDLKVEFVDIDNPV